MLGSLLLLRFIVYMSLDLWMINSLSLHYYSPTHSLAVLLSFFIGSKWRSSVCNNTEIKSSNSYSSKGHLSKCKITARYSRTPKCINVLALFPSVIFRPSEELLICYYCRTGQLSSVNNLRLVKGAPSTYTCRYNKRPLIVIVRCII